ncbi:hypothetical protein AB6A40_006487 [Gnathostoma spinigerum]|uniref:Uncharacterized protein n=1 Tax=Gnathostoma spinigerum TaxID=75299 RepID=A0ABD6EIH9_9BILA
MKGESSYMNKERMEETDENLRIVIMDDMKSLDEYLQLQSSTVEATFVDEGSDAIEKRIEQLVRFFKKSMHP